MHADLRLAGTLPPLDAPHHMRATEWATYREGVVLSSVPGEGSLLNVGLDKVSQLQNLPHTVKLAVHGYPLASGALQMIAVPTLPWTFGLRNMTALLQHVMAAGFYNASLQH